MYSGTEAVFVEEYIFKTIIPLVSDDISKRTNQATNQVEDQADYQTEKY